MPSATADEDTQRLLEALEQHGAAPLERLFAQLELHVTSAAVRRLALHAPVFLSDLKRAKANVLALALASKPGAESSAVTSDEQLVSLLQILAANTKSRAHTPAKLRELLPAAHRPLFGKALEQRIARGNWPAGVGAIRTERSTLVFFTEHVQTGRPVAPAAPEPAPPAYEDRFSELFARAFADLHDARRSNLVELAPLRTRLSAYDREQFDRGLRKLRESAQYVLQTFDGRHGELTPELEQAAIHEAGRTFVYVAKRTP